MSTEQNLDYWTRQFARSAGLPVPQEEVTSVQDILDYWTRVFERSMHTDGQDDEPVEAVDLFVEDDRNRSAALLETGWFSKMVGPFGQVPVQFFAVLTSGEFIYFRGRGKQVYLEIYPSQEDEEMGRNLIARYSMTYPVREDLPAGEVDFGAGVMPEETAVALIQEWVSTYLRHLQQARDVSARAEAAFGECA